MITIPTFKIGDKVVGTEPGTRSGGVVTRVAEFGSILVTDSRGGIHWTCVTTLSRLP